MPDACLKKVGCHGLRVFLSYSALMLSTGFSLAAYGVWPSGMCTKPQKRISQNAAHWPVRTPLFCQWIPLCAFACRLVGGGCQDEFCGLVFSDNLAVEQADDALCIGCIAL